MSAIAVWEWPEEWAELFDVLMTGVHSGNPCLINGSMQVLEGVCLCLCVCVCMCVHACVYVCVCVLMLMLYRPPPLEFCAELTDQQLPHIAPILFPELLKITSEEQVHTPSLSSNTLPSCAPPTSILSHTFCLVCPSSSPSSSCMI